MNSQQERKQHRMMMRKLDIVLTSLETEVGRMVKDESKTEFKEIVDGLRMVVTSKKPSRNPPVERYRQTELL